MSKRSSWSAAAAALLLAASAARAATVPLTPDGTVATGATGGAGGHVDFAVPLVRDQDYAVVGWPTGAVHASAVLELLDPAGRVLGRVGTLQEDAGGLGFRPTASAVYLVRVSFEPRQELRAYTAAALVRPDCRGGVTTRCSLRAGATIEGFTDFTGEPDAYQAGLMAGRNYAVEMAVPEADYLRVEVRDDRRRVLAWSEDLVRDVLGGSRVRVTFVPGVTGTYYLYAIGGRYVATYSLSLR